jgi:hypothetical protein
VALPGVSVMVSLVAVAAGAGRGVHIAPPFTDFSAVCAQTGPPPGAPVHDTVTGTALPALADESLPRLPGRGVPGQISRVEAAVCRQDCNSRREHYGRNTLPIGYSQVGDPIRPVAMEAGGDRTPG